MSFDSIRNAVATYEREFVNQALADRPNIEHGWGISDLSRESYLFWFKHIQQKNMDRIVYSVCSGVIPTFILIVIFQLSDSLEKNPELGFVLMGAWVVTSYLTYNKWSAKRHQDMIALADNLRRLEREAGEMAYPTNLLEPRPSAKSFDVPPQE